MVSLARQIACMAIGALSLALATPTFAQSASPTSATSTDSTLNPLAGIALTVEQRARIQSDWLARKATFAAIVSRLRASGGLSTTDRDQLRREVAARNDYVRSLLTAEQQQQLDTNLTQIAGRLKQRAASMGGTPR